MCKCTQLLNRTTKPILNKNMTTIAQIPKSPIIKKSVSLSRCTRKQAEHHEEYLISEGRTSRKDTISLSWDSSPFWHEPKIDASKLEFTLSLDSNGTIAASCDITKAELLEMVQHIEAIEAQQGLTLDVKHSFNPKE